jgi:hypothetical protein
MKTQLTNQHTNTFGVSPTKNRNASHFLVMGLVFLAFMLMVARLAEAQSTTNSVTGHGFVSVELAKSLNSKKLREGDEIDAKVAADIKTGDGATIPRGTKLIGHVTEAKARSKGDSESTLGIVFDKISRTGSGDMPIKSVVWAAAPNPKPDSPAGGVGYVGLSEAVEKATFPTPATTGVPLLNEQSTGVLGIKSLQLGPNGVFTSTGKEVKLDSGMQILLNLTM